MIEAKVTGARISSSYGNGMPEVTFDCEPVLEDVHAGSLATMFDGDGLGPGYGTDELAREAREHSDDVETLFTMIDSANQLGIDLGGFDVTVLDKEKFTRWVLENRPDALEDVPEEFYETHLNQ